MGKHRLAGVLLLFWMTAPLRADLDLFFGNHSGTIRYDGSGGNLTGNLTVDPVYAVPAQNIVGTATVVFETGPLLSWMNTGQLMDDWLPISSWTFGRGTLSVTAQLDLNLDHVPDVSGVYRADFDSLTVRPVRLGEGPMFSIQFNVPGLDGLAAFGIPKPPPQAPDPFLLGSAGGLENTLTARWSEFTVVPEPGAFALTLPIISAAAYSINKKNPKTPLI